MSILSARGTLPIRALLSLSVVTLLSGCLSSTATKPSELQLIGDWTYTAVQTSPLRENLAGQFRIISESGTSFQGRLDNVLATNEATGQTRVLDGTVSGSAEGNVIDFDANIESTPRRHVGQIVGETITGTWVSSSAGGGMSSGTFRAERETP
ncbi:MAG: hypothetical protein WD802_09750 [Gemmatimonadaceae bacterium]